MTHSCSPLSATQGANCSLDNNRGYGQSAGANASVLLSAPPQPGFETFTPSVEWSTAHSGVPFSGPDRNVTYRRHTRPLYGRHHPSGIVGDVPAMAESFTPVSDPFEDDRPHTLGSLDEPSLDIGDASALPGDFTRRVHSQQANQHHNSM